MLKEILTLTLKGGSEQFFFFTTFSLRQYIGVHAAQHPEIFILGRLSWKNCIFRRKCFLHFSQDYFPYVYEEGVMDMNICGMCWLQLTFLTGGSQAACDRFLL